MYYHKRKSGFTKNKPTDHKDRLAFNYNYFFNIALKWTI